MTSFHRLVAFALLLCAVAACSQVPMPGQVADLAPQAFGTPQNDKILDLTKYSGGVYAVGNTNGSLYVTNKGSGDVFVTKLGSDKRTFWGRQFGTSGDDKVTKVATDADGYVYLFGHTKGTLERANRGGYDFFLRKYTAAGRFLWTRQFGLETDDYPLDLVTTQNSVYVLGESDQKGYFVYRYTFSGGTYWKRQIGTASDASATPKLSLDGAGNVYVAKTIDGEVDPYFGNTSDIKLEKFSGAGTLLWTKVFNFAQDDYVSQIVASGNNVYLRGVRFDIPDDESFEWLGSVSGDGDLRWEGSIGVSSSYDSVFSGDTQLFVDGSGVYTDTVTVIDPPDDGPVSRERTLTKRSLGGSVVWEKDFLTFGTATAVAERGTGEVYVGGYTGSAYNPAAQTDALLLKLSAATGATVWSK